MGVSTTPDPSWLVTDLFERARTLAAAIAAPVGDPTTRRNLTTQALDLQRRCTALTAQAVPVRRRHRPRVDGALGRLSDAVDDLAAVVLMGCADAAHGRRRLECDVEALVGRIGERHDYVVGLLRRTGARRTYTTP
ncbi:MAG: hypothetical protein WC558_07125 [Patulibacter sp.]